MSIIRLCQVERGGDSYVCMCVRVCVCACVCVQGLVSCDVQVVHTVWGNGCQCITAINACPFSFSLSMYILIYFFHSYSYSYYLLLYFNIFLSFPLLSSSGLHVDIKRTHLSNFITVFHVLSNVFPIRTRSALWLLISVLSAPYSPARGPGSGGAEGEAERAPLDPVGPWL